MKLLYSEHQRVLILSEIPLTFLVHHPELGNLPSILEILIQLPFCLKTFSLDVLPLSVKRITAKTILSIEMIAMRSCNNCVKKVGLLAGKI